MHLLSPYAEHRSAVTDCEKLVSSPARDEEQSDHGFEAIPAATPLISSFSSCRTTRQMSRLEAKFSGLIHPVHEHGAVFAWKSTAGPQGG
jgi:hypothetical protein